MALRDRLNEALASTPADDKSRACVLKEALAAAGPDAPDSEIRAILSDLILKREQTAAAQQTAGHADLAAAARAEADALRVFLRPQPGESPAAASPRPAAPKSKPKKTAAPASGKIFGISKPVAIGLAAVIVIAVGVGIYLAAGSSSSPSLAASDQQAGIVIRPDDHTLGSPNAPIKMLEYAAPVCPHCARFDMEVFPLLKQHYIDTGKVYYILRVFPIQPADGAAQAIAECLPADNYFAFIDLLFRNQPKWDPEYGITDVHGALVQMARIAGMSADKVDQCINDKAEQERINQIAADGEAKYNIQGTPTFVVNGKVVRSGDFPWEDVQKTLDPLLPKQ